MAAQRLIRRFIGASALAIYAGCSHTPVEPEKAATDIKVFVPDPAEVAKLRKNFRDKAELEAFEIEVTSVALLGETEKLKDLAGRGKITQAACRLIDPPDALKQLKDMKDAYATAVSKEVQFDGETEEGKAKRLSGMEKILQKIEINRQSILDACSAKFSL